MSTRQKAIFWTNADPFHWRIYEALGEGITDKIRIDGKDE